MLIINQDLDQVFTKGTKPMLKVPVYNNGIFFGYNLMLGKDAIGFFDDLEQAEKEEQKINDCNQEVYTVSGFSDYDGGEDFEEILLQINRLTQGK